MSESSCSPASHKHFIRSGSCFPKNALEMMAKAFNDSIKSQQVQMKPIRISNDKKQLWKQLSARFFAICRNHEACWLETPILKQTGIHGQLIKHFRPPKPLQWYSNPHAWLSNFDIQKVMSQYEDAYRDFLFLGVFPIDFASPEPGMLSTCIGDALCKLDVAQLWTRRKQFGAIFNLDRHDQGGSHWVAVYCNLNPKKTNYGIYFYDSNGLPPPSEIAALQHSVAEQVKRVGARVTKPFVIDYNNVQHQFENTECGIYTMYFLHRCLRKISFDVIKKHVVTDKQVHVFRNRFYRENSQYILKKRDKPNTHTMRIGGNDPVPKTRRSSVSFAV
jgi:hypothetical protein